MCSPDTLFKHFQNCLDAEVKRLTWLEVGSNIKEGKALSGDEKKKAMEARDFWRFITESSVGHGGFPDWQEFFHFEFEVEKRTVT